MLFIFFDEDAHNVGPGLPGASSIKSIWLNYSGHPDYFLGSLFKGNSSGRRRKIPRDAFKKDCLASLPLLNISKLFPIQII